MGRASGGVAGPTTQPCSASRRNGEGAQNAGEEKEMKDISAEVVEEVRKFFYDDNRQPCFSITANARGSKSRFRYHIASHHITSHRIASHRIQYPANQASHRMAASGRGWIVWPIFGWPAMSSQSW